MSILQRLRRWLNGSEQKTKYSYTLGELPKLRSTDSATRENEKRLFDSLAFGPPPDFTSNNLYQLWINLSPREQDVTALTCLKYTNPQIAARLGVSKETVRTYLEKALIRLNARTKADLRVIFADWDFSEWERRKTYR